VLEERRGSGEEEVEFFLVFDVVVVADEKKVGSKKEVHPEGTGTWFFLKDTDDKAFLQIQSGELGEISQGL